MEPSFNDSRAFVDFLRQLFDALDEDESGALTPDEIIFPLLAYGLCPDAHYIETAFQVIFHCTDLSKIVIEREEFVSMFKEDSKTDRILQFLHANASSMQCFQEDKITNRSESAPIRLHKDEMPDLFPLPKLIYFGVEEYIRLIKLW